tara:strand:- start:77 stop:1375 length:1299 start_codon:yes stop_codon:yes gene_type:complete
MGSGTCAALAAYDTKGTQGTATTCKLEGDEDAMSVYFDKNETTKQVLFGSAFSEVPQAGGSGPIIVGGASNSVIFDVNNDIDVLGDMILRIEYKAGQDSSTIGAQGLAGAVGRVEIIIGTQTWQCLEKDDLMALTATETSHGAYQDYSFQTSGGVHSGNQYINANPAVVTFGLSGGYDPNSAIAFIPLKAFNWTRIPNLENFAEHVEDGYPVAAAPNQQVRVRVFSDSGFTDVPAGSTSASTLQFNLFAKNQIMCNDERHHIRDMPGGLPKKIKMTQNKNYSINQGVGTVEVDLDHFSLYTSHLILSFPSAGLAGLKQLNQVTVELLLNSTSFSGKLPLGLLRLTASTMGLYTNQYLVAGTNDSRRITFVFPLASRAYGGSSVPLNKFENIRLKIMFGSTAVYSSGAPHVNVTCAGMTTGLFNNGAGAIAMY